MSLSINTKDKKIKLLQSFLRKNKIGLALLNSEDLFYFTGIKTDGFLLIPNKGKPSLFLNPLEIQNYSSEKLILKSDFNLLKEKIKTNLVGFNFNTFSLKSYSKFKCRKKDISDFICKLRKVKTESEIKLIRKSCLIAQNIMVQAIANINKTLFTEKDIHKFLILQTIMQDCSLAFDPVVASGKNAAIPHALPNSKKLKKGFLVIDFGVKYKGYCSDITRTIYIGKPSKKEVKLYQNLLDVQKKAIIKSKYLVGKPLKELDNYARQELSLHNLADKFNHGIGHGFGTKVHEHPFIGPKTTEVLENNVVFTIEPGVYDIKKGYGIRIEDDVLLQDNKVKILTNKLSKDLIVIKK